MLTLPAELLPLIVEFAPLFTQTGLGARENLDDRRHSGRRQTHCHCISSGDRLLRMLVMTFASSGALIIGIDDTIERRRDEKIKAKGIYRDPVRYSQSHFVKASGLRWLCSMLLVEIPWAGCVYAKEETIAQVHGIGPVQVVWVNPADDPMKKAAGN
jgi:hypothetical protein